MRAKPRARTRERLLHLAKGLRPCRPLRANARWRIWILWVAEEVGWCRGRPVRRTVRVAVLRRHRRQPIWIVVLVHTVCPPTTTTIPAARSHCIALGYAAAAC